MRIYAHRVFNSDMLSRAFAQGSDEDDYLFYTEIVVLAAGFCWKQR